MKYTYAFISVALFIMAAVLPNPAVASQKTSASSAAFTRLNSVQVRDNRAQILQKYLEQYDSPLAGSAQTFVSEADRYNLDWKLVVSIAGVESWYGRMVPPYSYNGWGYGVYGANVRYFSSWDDAIQTISYDLREKYMNEWGATDISSIGRIYAADPAWATKVTYFMGKLDAFQASYVDTRLSISL
jgi:hypothetical protein